MPDNVIEVISSVGFPICCVLIMMYYIKDKDAVHSEEIKGFMQAIGDLTNKIDNLVTKIDTLINYGGKNE